MATKNKKLNFDAFELMNQFNSYFASKIITNDEILELKQINDNIAALNKKLHTQKNFEVSAGIDLNKIDYATLEEDVLKFDEVFKYKPMFDMISTAKSTSDIKLENTDVKVMDFIRFLPTYKKYSAELIKKYNSLEEAQAYFSQIEQAINMRESVESELNDLTARKEFLDKKKEAVDQKEEYFNQFLTENGFQTTHAKDVYDFLYNDKELNLDKDSYNMRKKHTIRDNFIKKGVIPTAIVSAGVGSVIGSIASKSLIAGTSAFGVIPVYGSIALTTFATASLGAVAGLIATPAILVAKKQLTKLHYNIWYKNASQNLKDYEAGVDIENLPITVLMEKIQKTKHQILNMNEGSKISKFLKFIPKHILNAVNRNRLHHIEKFTKDLVQIDAYFPSEKTKNLLELVENFVANDIEESKLNAMLNCKQKGKHIHKTIENIDIYANLKIYLDTVNPTSTNKTIKQAEKQARRIMNNIRHKSTVANNIMLGERLIPRLIREKALEQEELVDNDVDYNPEPGFTPPQNAYVDVNSADVDEEAEIEPLVTEIEIPAKEVDEEPEKEVDEVPEKEIPEATINPRKVVSQVIINGKMHVETANGKKHILSATEVKPLPIDTINVNQGVKTLTYEDGSKTTIFPESMDISLRLIEKNLDNDIFLINAITAVDGYDQKVFANLKTKLHNWCADSTGELNFTTSEKRLLNAAFKEYRDNIKVNNNTI